MKDFSIRQMRCEYRGVLRACTQGAAAVLLCGAVFGAFSLTRHLESRYVLAGVGIAGFFALLFLAAYLICSDEKRLLKKTPYGRALAQRGEPWAVMRDIDRDAEAFLEEHGSYVLMTNWLILKKFDGCRFDPFRVSAYPIPKGEIRAIRQSPVQNPHDPQQRYVQIFCQSETHSISVFQQRDLDALLLWMDSKEQINQ